MVASYFRFDNGANIIYLLITRVYYGMKQLLLQLKQCE